MQKSDQPKSAATSLLIRDSTARPVTEFYIASVSSGILGSVNGWQSVQELNDLWRHTDGLTCPPDLDHNRSIES